MSQPFNHILVIRLSALGDVAMLVPVIRQLLVEYPSLEITVLTRSFFRPLFDEFDRVNVLEARVDEEHKGIFGLKKLASTIKALNVDAVADCHFVLRSRIIRFFTGIQPWVQIDKGRADKKALIRGKEFKPLKTTHQRYVEVFEELGFPVDISTPEFPDSPAIPKILDQIELKAPLVGIAPFAAHPGKAYPIDLMKKVIAGLANSATVLLFGGGKEELRAMKEIEEQFDHVHSVSNLLSFKDELSVIRNLDLMLSMDSGNAHLAAAYGVETITLWGVTHPFAGFAPFNQEEGNCLLADRSKFPKIPTSVYGNKAPAGYELAIATIEPQAILEKIKGKLSTA